MFWALRVEMGIRGGGEKEERGKKLSITTFLQRKETPTNESKENGK